jgi:hypothetical protein
VCQLRGTTLSFKGTRLSSWRPPRAVVDIDSGTSITQPAVNTELEGPEHRTSRIPTLNIKENAYTCNEKDALHSTRVKLNSKYCLSQSGVSTIGIEGGDHYHSHCRLAEFRVLMIKGKYSAVIDWESSHFCMSSI